MKYVLLYAIVCGAFLAGYVTCALLANARRRYPLVRDVQVQHVSPQAMTAMAEALSNAGEMLNSGDFEYLSGGIMVQDHGHGVVNIRGDLSLRAKEYEQG